MPKPSSFRRYFVLFLMGITLLTYGNSLFNDFVGDDHIFFTANNFYKKLEDVPRLFQKDFIVKFSDFYTERSTSKSAPSGVVSYRPVTGLSFFVGHALWKNNPFGHHVDNLLFHLGAALLFYFLAIRILKNEKIAGLAALLFAVHPINSEAVNCIGYRSDLLCGLFFLASFLAFIKYREGLKTWLIVSYVSFFLALFAKEAAVILFLLVIVYDLYFSKREEHGPWHQRPEYLGYLAILLFYLYVYIFVFPNSAYIKVIFSSFWLPLWILTSLKILYIYVQAFILPFYITVLPPVYCPPISSFKIFELIFVLAFIVICLWAVFRRSKEISFCIVWFFLAYLPVANLIPLPNPVAFRFMYIPMMGLMMVAAILIEKAAVFLTAKIHRVDLGKYLKFSVIVLCVTTTMSHNMFFQNDLILFREMIHHYPDSSKPYMSLGMVFLATQQYPKAIENLNTYLEKEKNNVFYSTPDKDYLVYARLGMCYGDNPEAAVFYLKKALALNPTYGFAYAVLAKVYALNKDYGLSLAYAQKAIEYNGNLSAGYVYGVLSLLSLKKWDQARDLFDKALRLFPEDPDLISFKKHLENKTSPDE